MEAIKNTFCIEWMVETAEGVLEDLEIIRAYDRDGAMGKFVQIEDIPEGAQITAFYQMEGGMW